MAGTQTTKQENCAVCSKESHLKWSAPEKKAERRMEAGGPGNGDRCEAR